jgi:hypothetical protein
VIGLQWEKAGKFYWANMASGLGRI